MNHELLKELRYARNGFRSAEADAEGFVSGKRIYNLRAARERYEKALWDAREELDVLLRHEIEA